MRSDVAVLGGLQGSYCLACRGRPSLRCTERFGPMRTANYHAHGFHIPFSIGTLGIMTLNCSAGRSFGSAASHEQPRVTGLITHTLSAPHRIGEIT